MSVHDSRSDGALTDVSNSKLLRIALWVAIGALIAAALVCVIWVLIGSQNGLIGRAFLTIVLLAGFAGVAILDARLAPRRPAWFALTSMIVWVITLLIGAFLIWVPERASAYFGSGVGRFMSFLLIVLVLQLALLHVRLFTSALARRRTAFTAVVGYITMGLVGLLAVMLVLPLMLSEWVDFHDIYWRLVVAVTILAAVGTALVPLVNALFAPRQPQASAPPLAPGQLPPGWPTYADAVTALPVLPDGSPDWNAYYTGFPSPQAVVFAPPPQWQAQAQPQAQPTQVPVQQPWGASTGQPAFPPPPPLPPQQQQQQHG